MNIKETSLSDIKESIKQMINENSLFKLPPVIIIILFQYILPHTCSNIIYIFTKKRKKRKTTIGFSNLYYTGNPRAVFECILKNNGKYEIFWVARNLRTIKDVQKAGGKSFFINGFLGIYRFLKTDLWIIAHTGRDIPFLPHKNFRIIQLWHGIGPKGISPSKKDYDKYDAWCVASEYSKQRHIELWDAPNEKIIVTGYAEMDRLLQYLNSNRNDLLKSINVNDNSKIILYAPTFEVGLWPWGDQYLEFEKLCMFCNKNNVTLILRLHPYAQVNKRNLKNIIKKYENVLLLDMQKEPDTMKLLAIAGILITDWSSIYTNYFLTKRPVIYLQVDKKYYTKIRGKGVIPPEYRAGEIVNNNEEFFKAMNIVLKGGNRYKKEQERLLKIIHGNVDGNSSKRVVELIERLIKKD